MINLMIIVFIIGYLLITLEHKININKSSIALLLGAIMWVLYSYSLSPEEHSLFLGAALAEHIADITEIILFLLGAMTTVEIIDRHGGFNFVSKIISTTDKRKLLWMISLITFILSAALDNLTTSIVMIMVLRKLMSAGEDRMIIASMIILAANAGGAFSPIGDVTTIMLWINGNISAINTIKGLLLPSLVSIVVPLIILSFKMKGCIDNTSLDAEIDDKEYPVTIRERVGIFVIGVGGLLLVPVFKEITSLPPFLGVIAVVSFLWLYTDILYGQRRNLEESEKCRVVKVLKNVDFPTIFFFFGILLAVAGLQQAGILSDMANWLNTHLHNVYMITGSIGLLSSVVDNVPLVAGSMGMYDIVDPSLALANDYSMMFAQDGTFWQLIAYCAGVGGSMLIIGSAAGVVVMGLEKIDFFWYLKKITGLAFIGYVSGMLVYFLM